MDKKDQGEASDKQEVSDKLIDKVSKLIPGFGSFFKKAQNSKTFGARMKEIREEMNRRFGGKL